MFFCRFFFLSRTIDLSEKQQQQKRKRRRESHHVWHFCVAYLLIRQIPKLQRKISSMPIVINTLAVKWILTVCISLHQCLKSFAALFVFYSVAAQFAKQARKVPRTSGQRQRRRVEEKKKNIKHQNQSERMLLKIWSAADIKRNQFCDMRLNPTIDHSIQSKTLTLWSWDRFKCRLFLSTCPCKRRIIFFLVLAQSNPFANITLDLVLRPFCEGDLLFQ